MSIYIPYICMPRNCQECFICTRCDGACDIADEVEYSVLKRPDGCPLIEVPPHGRLGDLDALDAKLLQDGFGRAITRRKSTLTYGDARQYVQNAETIIPADKEEP